MERTFENEIGLLRLGAGETFRGEGILAITKGLLQSGVSYVGGYQGAPVSHLLDVLVSARDLMGEMGIHVESCANEASAAAMLAASINYPVRGAVTWKSIVGTNVASDALSNLASTGVTGGALIVIGEDFGEGASVIQERTYAYAMKSAMLLVDPRPNLASMVDMVEHAFALSEASHMPAMMQLRIRACHVQGEFTARNNVKPAHGTNSKFSEPADFFYPRLAHPPVIYSQEVNKVSERIPAARAYIREHGLNDRIAGTKPSRLGLVIQGGLYNTVMRQLGEMGLADENGTPDIDILCLNVTYPLVPDELIAFARDKDRVLVIEEGNPAYMEQQMLRMTVDAGLSTRIDGKNYLPEAGEYTGEVLAAGLGRYFLENGGNILDLDAIRRRMERMEKVRAAAGALLEAPLPPRQPTFCTGCPERPVFGAIKLAERTVGKVHVSADIGCHAFGTFAPFNQGNSILGYGLSLASMAAVTPMQERRSLAIMGDGGFWHNGVQTGVASNLYNKGDGVLIIMNNGYTSATGQQVIPSSKHSEIFGTGAKIATTLEAMGVKWLRTVRTYSVETMVKTLKEAFTTTQKGLKVIIADGECMLARQRRERSEKAQALKEGRRVEQAKFGVDAEVCTGDHSCIRLSGCPSLGVATNPDPLRKDPIAEVKQDCVACGLCGEMAHAAVLCPSFYRAARIHNAGWFERTLHRIRTRVIGAMAGAA
ncbi:indolepyruvate ferredoxin oxidoreductase subunit alpha [Breoghania sp. JC706]|uniref:indolepyruvate ferredoxin oxidoreductase subunit alpha n=1 Tax=Breoghania sp. JC706 TaxID=3117732 RepID=UPI003008F0E6